MSWIADAWNIITGGNTQTKQDHWNRQSHQLALNQFDFAKSAYLMDQNTRGLNRRWDENFATERYRHGLENTVNQAKAAGINPLVALGKTPFVGSPSNIGGANFSATPTPTYNVKSRGTLSGIDHRLAAEHLKQAKLTTAKMKNDIYGQADGPVVPTPDRPVAGKGGATSGLHQQYKVVGDDSGGYRLQNRETSEFEEDPLGWFQTAGRKIGLYGKSLFYPALSKRQKQIVRNALKRQRAIMEYVDPPGPGRTYKRSRRDGKWYKARKDGNLFLSETTHKAISVRKIPPKKRQPGLKKKYDYIHITPPKRR